MQAHAEMLRGLNTKVTDYRVALSNVRASRDKILFDRPSIYDAAKAVKHYAKEVFGFRSIADNQIKGLKFITKKLA